MHDCNYVLLIVQCWFSWTFLHLFDFRKLSSSGVTSLNQQNSVATWWLVTLRERWSFWRPLAESSTSSLQPGLKQASENTSF